MARLKSPERVLQVSCNRFEPVERRCPLVTEPEGLQRNPRSFPGLRRSDRCLLVTVGTDDKHQPERAPDVTGGPLTDDQLEGVVGGADLPYGYGISQMGPGEFMLIGPALYRTFANAAEAEVFAWQHFGQSVSRE
jgi:hypothetical protein